MSHNGRSRRRKIKLWLEDCRCYWCRQPTILVVCPSGMKNQERYIPSFSKQATIDHLNHRQGGKRKQIYNVETTVLACRECNEKRGAEEERLYLENKKQFNELREVGNG